MGLPAALRPGPPRRRHPHPRERAQLLPRHRRQLRPGATGGRFAATEIVWDPANAFCSGEYRAYPDGYTAVRPHIGHFHVKDARIIDPTTGKAAWQTANPSWPRTSPPSALVDDRYAGIVSIETHWKIPGDTGERATLETWRGLAGLLDRLRAPVR